MEKHKICPSCGAKNPPDRIECDLCEADLTGVPITAYAPEEEKKAAARFVRLCDCGAENPPQARRCAVCGEDISDIPAVEIGEVAAPEEAPPRPQLVSLDGSYVYELCEKELLIGRYHDLADYLDRFRYVSRTQAKLSWRENHPVLTSLSRSNPTYINDQALAFNQSRPLHDGDEIGLGGCVIDGERQDDAAYLIVRLPPEKNEQGQEA